jgi:hypothetical protein
MVPALLLAGNRSLWLPAQGPRIVPIPGSRSPGACRGERRRHLALTLTGLARIAEILPTGGFGKRYAGVVPVWD